MCGGFTCSKNTLIGLNVVYIVSILQITEFITYENLSNQHVKDFSKIISYFNLDYWTKNGLELLLTEVDLEKRFDKKFTGIARQRMNKKLDKAFAKRILKYLELDCTKMD